MPREPRQHVRYERRGQTAIITLHREPKNALDSRTMREIFDAFDEADRDEAIRVVVLTGGIRNCFSIGADTSQLFGEGIANDLRTGNHGPFLATAYGYRRIEELDKVVISAINGACIGAGLELALCTDLRIASELAVFQLPEAAHGIVPGIGATQRLTRLIGAGPTKEMFFLGRMARADEALQWGLVNRLVPPGRLLEESLAWAEQVAAAPPGAVAAIKRCINRAANLELEAGLEFEINEFIETMRVKLLGEDARVEAVPPDRARRKRETV